MSIEPTLQRTHPVGNGTQKIYRFDNGFGASVVQFEVMPGVGSYGVGAGLWEMAVLRFEGEGTDSYELTYDTPITDDVLGNLDDEAVEGLLGRIRDLTAEGCDPAPVSTEAEGADR